MKLATLRDGSRDGLLAVVSHDLSLAHVATGRARTLQQVLDDWNFLSPQLEELSATLNHGKARHAFSFDPRQCMAPLPRAYGWVQALPGETALHHAAGHRFWGPTDAPRFQVSAPADIPTAGSPGAAGTAEAAGAEPNSSAALAEPPPLHLWVHAGLAALTGDIAAGADEAQALEGVRLLLLAAHWDPGLQPGSETVAATATPAQRTAFAPLAVTPDELGPAWQRGRVHATLLLQGASRSQQRLAAEQALDWQPLGFGRLLARLAAAGPVPAGTLVGTGALGEGLSGTRAEAALRLECTGSDGGSVFGALAQRLADEG